MVRADTIWDTQNVRLTFATDKKVRDQALESLRTFLGAQTEISELDLLKLWKGLFYCTLCANLHSVYTFVLNFD